LPWGRQAGAGRRRDGPAVAGLPPPHVFVSKDAGEHFKDISGDLPDLAASWIVLHDGDLIVAKDLGVYSLAGVAKAPAKPHYGVVGVRLPKAPVVHLQITPRNRNELLAASYGRGVQVITLKAGSISNGATRGAGPQAAAAAVHRGVKGTLTATGPSTRLGVLSLLLFGTGLVSRRCVVR
jgi:hypothetical protein